MDYSRTETRVMKRCAVRGGPVTEVWNLDVGYYLDENDEEREEDISEALDAAATAALPANQSPADKRRAAYVAEADPIRAQAEGYETEALVLRENGDTEKADAAEAKAASLRVEYVAKKEEIRARIPDPAYYLSSTGTYHAAGCQYATGEALTLAAIAAASPEAKPCSRCGPPALG